MAKSVTTRIIDDLDGKSTASTVLFSFDGVQHEIDLSADNLAKFTKAVAPYVAAARKVTVAKAAPSGRGRRRSAALNGSRASSAGTGDIREWANSHGFSVSARGRIAADVIAAFQSSQSASGTGSARPAAKRTVRTAAAPTADATADATADSTADGAAPARRTPAKRAPRKAAAAKTSRPAKKAAGRAPRKSVATPAEPAPAE